MPNTSRRRSVVEHPPEEPQAAQDAISDPVHHLQETTRQGTPWHQALLETAGMWTLPEEEHQERTYRYLLQGEAFDWLVLAERLCPELDGLAPADELETLLFHGQLPQEVDSAQLQRLLGISKHRAYMNYWYGVVVEEALQLAVEEEVRKERRSNGRADSDEVEDIVFARLYKDAHDDLLRRFRQETGCEGTDTLTLAQLKGFTYWLFKHRVGIWDPARVASDTRKGLDRLEALRRG